MELRQNSSVQNAFLKRNASKAFHIYTGRKYRETNKSHQGEFFFLMTRIAQFVTLRQLLHM